METWYSHYWQYGRWMAWIGAWPYINPKIALIKYIAWNFNVSLVIFVEVAAVVTGKYEIDTIICIRNLCFALIMLGNWSKYNSFMKHRDGTRHMMESIKTTWNSIDDENMLKILNKRILIGKKEANRFVAFFIPATAIMVLCRTGSYLLVTIAPPEANITDPFPILTDYIILSDNYFFLKVLHQNIAFVLVLIMGSGTESVYIMWMQHCTALYEIARLVAHMKKEYTFSYGFLIALSIATLAMNFFRISTAIRITHDMQEISAATILTLTQVVYMSYINYLMENVVEYSNNIRFVVYDLPWYNRTRAMRNDVLVFTVGTTWSIKFDYYGVFNASLEGFGALMKLAMSYFTVMLSLQAEDN